MTNGRTWSSNRPKVGYKKFLKFVSGAFVIAVVLSFPVAILVNQFVETHTQMFMVGATIGSLCMGGVLAQVFLLHEQRHHYDYLTPIWMPKMRLRLVMFAVSQIAFLLAGFYPIEHPGIPWKNPVVSVFNATGVLLAGTLAPYVIKLIDDVTGYDSDYIDKVIKRLMLVIPVLFATLVVTIYLLFMPNEPIEKVAQHLITSVAGEIGLFYGFMGQKPESGWESNSESRTEVPDYWIVEKLQKVRLHTFFLAIIGWIGIILAAGTQRLTAEDVFGQEVYIFPLLLAARGVFQVGGTVLLFILISVIFSVLASSIRWLHVRI